MQKILNTIKQRPLLLLWLPGGMIAFGIFILILTAYPLIWQALTRATQALTYAETWLNYLSYIYNGTSGGIMNIVNTALFGIWLTLSQVYHYIISVDQEGCTEPHDTRGMVATAIAALGSGCVGCGLTFLGNILGASTGAFLATLPWGGTEFGLIGALFLIISIAYIYVKIQTFVPGVCEIE